MNYIDKFGDTIQTINGVVYDNGNRRSWAKSAEEYIKHKEHRINSINESIDRLEKVIISKVLSENTRLPLSNTDFILAKDSVINEELSYDPIAIRIRQVTKSYNPFGKHQIVLESGEKISVSQKTLTKLIESKKIPISINEVLSILTTNGYC
jgi:hypothetical protein